MGGRQVRPERKRLRRIAQGDMLWVRGGNGVGGGKGVVEGAAGGLWKVVLVWSTAKRLMAAAAL